MGFQKKYFGPIVQRQRAVLKNCALKDDDARVSCHVTDQQSHSKKAFCGIFDIFRSDIFLFDHYGMHFNGKYTFGIYLSITENLFVFFATLLFPIRI